MKAFFTITHTDIVNCLGQLNDLRLTDHTIEIEKGGMAVHVEVCSLMRAKLVSEVKANVQKLKVSYLVYLRKKSKYKTFRTLLTNV